MWRSADGQSWAEVPYPAPDEGTYGVVALSGAADGSYVFHAYHFSDSATSDVSLRSTDGETWEPLETGLPSDLSILAIEEGPAGYLLVAGQGMADEPHAVALERRTHLGARPRVQPGPAVRADH